MDEDAGPREAEGRRHIGCSMTGALLALVRRHGGQAAVETLLAEAGRGHGEAFLSCAENWIALDHAMALLEAGTRITGDPRFARRVGEQAVRQHAGSAVATLLRSLGSPEAVLDRITLTAAKFSTVTDMEPVECGPGRAVVRAVARPGFTRHRLHCDWAAGLLSQPPVLFGLPPARVEESECQARGGSQCLYTVSWDAEQAAVAADPEQRVTALEAQLVAMSERLEAAYATAGDLVSPDALDTVLMRIVDRAAAAVRAPGYVLAVRPAADGGLQVYSDGVDAAEASRLSTAVLAGEPPPASALVAEVASGRHDYGRLIALLPDGMRFFAQEQQLLTVYARHAAAVLDMATALDEAARRNEQVSALLALAHQLAHAGTTEEVAERLATAVPGVVGCDRIGVWLWDAAGDCLRCAAGTAGAPEETTLLRRHPIGAADTPYVAWLRADPQPLFLRRGDEDPFMARLMEKLDLAALTIVPIVARAELLGIITVAVVDAPERLAPGTALAERLEGVAALAATALQNGRLVDALAHRASHDHLTGLANRAGFGTRIGRELDGGRRGGLLFIDLDGFKNVNDLYGHDAGDEVLRMVAERLSELVRGDDSVARLGGDEFAVILSDVSSEEQVRVVADRVRAAFAEPFELAGTLVSVGASVGEAMWPDEGRTVEALIRQADSAMYGDKARAR